MKKKLLVILSGSLLLSSSSVLADDSIVAGKAIYDGSGACFSCHGALGKGDGAAAAALNPKPRDLTTGKFTFDTDADGKPGTEADLFNVITNGAQKYGGSMLMAGRPDLSDADRKAVVKYILSLKK